MNSCRGTGDQISSRSPKPPDLRPPAHAYDDRDVQAAANVATAIVCMEPGNLSNAKLIAGGLGEYGIDWGPGYRLYLTPDGDQLVILFVGGSKKRQRSDINQASALPDALRKHREVAFNVQAVDRSVNF